MDFKIIQSWLYHERIIYLTQIGDKFQMFYRSSGRAGHNSKGNVLPCYTLKLTLRSMGDEFGSMSYGWIPKVYKEQYFKPYFSKDMERFPLEMQKYFKELQNFDFSDTILEEDSPVIINAFVANYIKSDDDWYDWKSDE